MASPVDIIINAIWRGRGSVENARRDLGKLGRAGEQGAQGIEATGEAFRRTDKSVGSLVSTIGKVTIALGTISLAAREAFRRLERGAGIELTTMRFDRLAESVGTTGEALRADLSVTVAGMLSNTQQMALATDLLALNLATTHDEAVRFARVVTELDQDLNQLTQALANQSTRRLDQLGVSVVVFREKLEALGDTMSDEDAYRMAFLQAAEQQIGRVGGASDTAAGDIRRLQADWAALNEEIDRFLAFKFGPALADASGRTEREFVNMALEAANAADSVEDVERAHRDLLRAAEDLERNYPVDFAVDPASVELLRALARMTDSAEEFEQTAVRIFGPQGFVSAIVESGHRSAEVFYEVETSLDAHEAAMIRNDEIMRQYAADTRETTEALADMDEILQRVERTLATYSDELASVEAFEARREGVDVSSFLAEQSQAQLAADFELLQQRADLFQEFQADLNDITARESERRAEIEQQFESRRNDIIEDYGERRTKLEQKLQEDIADVREDSEERRNDLREDANKRLQDLEQDHVDRMQEIVEDANRQLAEAASGLDARAVARIERQRDDALQDEQDRYGDARDDILETLEERLEAEREAEAERIKELREFHADRAREEAEAHRKRLQELDRQERERLTQLRQQAIQERNERERQYTQERLQLEDHWDNKAQLEREWMQTILRQEEQWWRQRSNLVGGGDAGDIGGGDTGGDDDGVGGSGGGDGQWSRYRMEHTALRVANPTSTDAALAWQRYFRSLTNEQLAAWIEQHSDIDVPGYRYGGVVSRDMMALVGEAGPEIVRLPGGARVYDTRTSKSMMGGVNMGNVSITVNESQRPGQTGKEVRRELEKLLREIAA